MGEGNTQIKEVRQVAEGCMLRAEEKETQTQVLWEQV